MNKRFSITCSAMLFCGIAGLSPRANAQGTDAVPKAHDVVLVHGAWADGSSWSEVVPLLEKAGLHVVSVQNSLSSLTDDVAATQRALALQDGPVVLVGHSWGGTVISQAGTDPKVSSLVYIAALAPDKAENINTIFEKFSKPPISAGLVDKQGFTGLSQQAFFQDFVSDVPPSKKPALYAAQGWIADGLFESPTSAVAWKLKPTFYMVAANDRTINPDAERYMAKRMNAVTVEVASGHTAMISHPQDVADLILKAAGF